MHQLPVSREPLHDFSVLMSTNPDDMHRQMADDLAMHRLEVIGRRERSARVNRVQVHTTTLMYVDYGVPVRVSAPEPLGHHVVVLLPIAAGMRIEIGGESFAATPNRAAVIPCQTAARFVGEPEINCLVVRVDINDLSRHLHRLAPHSVHYAPVFDPARQMNPALITSAIHALHQPFDLGLGNPPPLVQQELHRQMMSALLFGSEHSASRKLFSPAPEASKDRILHAVKLIDEAPVKALNLVSLAESVDLSLRSLQEGFRQHLGTSPRVYVKRARFERAHATLLAADPDDGTTVTDVAFEHGFTHLGRFAAEYRDAFGESPSESLHRP